MRPLKPLIFVGLAFAFTTPCLAQSGTGQQPSAPASSAGTSSEAVQQQSSATPKTGGASTPDTSSSGGQQAAAPSAVQQKMRSDLESAGFTDVHIMPESFLVRARDPQGRPVMMVVNPDSVVAMTRAGADSGASGAAPNGTAPGVSGSSGAGTSGSSPGSVSQNGPFAAHGANPGPAGMANSSAGSKSTTTSQ